MMTPYRTSTGHKESGLTLIEIMVALTLSLLLLAGVIQIFLASKQSYRLSEENSRIQENGRFAIDILARDLRMADFWGCASNISSITNNLNSTNSGYIAFDSGIGGTNGVGTASDSIVINSAFSGGINLTAQMPNTSANLQIPANAGLEFLDILILSDCNSGDIFQITNTNPDSGALNHASTNDCAGGGPTAKCPGNNRTTGTNACPAGDCLSKAYGTDATVFRVRSLTYNIQTGANGQNALFRAGVELVSNVENMQILYGEDTDITAANPTGDGVANRYLEAGNGALDMERVVSVRIAMLIVSSTNVLPSAVAQSHPMLDVTLTPNDNLLRRVFTTTVAIRNRLP